ncbi:hypothetical protein [Actinomadura sp. BRA 177]|uniref:hypothetical protein n=1 Tax=Actinomadura sp. BRA 177 TaxID=2745202 RepID=UPI001C3D35AE|nr:hypothetical protein [Actinomadura sp. BRA 177]
MSLFDNIACPLREHNKKSESEVKRIVLEKMEMVGLLGAEQADHLHLLEDDALDLGLGLLVVLAQRAGDVVEQAHRAQPRAVPA